MSFISKVTEKVAEKFEDGNTFKFEDYDMLDPDLPWISTGSPCFDKEMNTFGLPMGIVEVRGESQSGKTTISLQAMKSCLEQYGDNAMVVILSSERRDNKAYAMQMGIDTSKILLRRVTTIEHTFNAVFQTVKYTNQALAEMFHEDAKAEKIKVKSKEYEEYIEKRKEEHGYMRYLFVWDALGQTVADQELKKAKENAEKGEAGKSALAAGARALAAGLRSIMGLMDEEDVTLLIINRPYDKTDGSPGKKSYGGKAIELYPTLRIELARIQGVKVGETEVGQITQVKLLKTDFTTPKKKFNIEIGYGLGIMLSKQDFEIAVKKGIVEKFGIGGGKYLKGKKELKWKTRKELYKLYEERDPMLQQMIIDITNAVHDEIYDEHVEKMERLK